MNRNIDKAFLGKSIETYIQAKDGNRPHLIEDAFMPDAELVMELKTDEISFPSNVKGPTALQACSSANSRSSTKTSIRCAPEVRRATSRRFNAIGSCA
ncbi:MULTISPECIES: hypothetical protein [Burkholderia]|uniref:hypothetical protein n=1 Tax=Burkholderia TaxID=32008 RepID=UPI000AB730BE|nr:MULTISPECIES: hypothetical protein [Burkholderia]